MVAIDAKIAIAIAVIYAIGMFCVGYILNKGKQKQDSKLKMLVELAKYVISNEYIPPEGKINSLSGIFVIIAALILSLPLTFAFIYKAIFNENIIDLNVFYYIFIYFAVCSLIVTIVRTFIHAKLQLINKDTTKRE